MLLGSLAEAASVYEQFEQKISELETRLKAEKKVTTRYDLFLATHANLLQLRKANPRQDELDEISMSFFLDTLADLPTKKKFEPKKCADYEKKAKTMMSSRKAGGEDAAEPMVTRALGVVRLICR